MIYDKPRDINLRVFPSLSSFAPKKRKKTPVEEAKTPKPQPKKTIAENRKDTLVLPQKSIDDFQEEPIIDISTMPVVDGIPMLDLSDKATESKPITTEKNFAKPTFDILNKPIIDISEMPDIEGIPLLKLPEEIHPDVLKEISEIGKATEVVTVIPDKVTETSDKKVVAPPVKVTETEPKKKQKTTKTKEKKTREKKKLPAKINKTYLFKAASFFVTLYLGMTIAFIIPLRPTYSETEKRNLKEFPEFSAEALISGSFFDDISTWFSDTFPYREFLTKANTSIKSLYGFDDLVIHGDIESGDEIPDIPLQEEITEQETTPPQPETTKPVTMPNQDELQTDNGDPNAQKPDIKTQTLGAIIVAGDTAYEYYSFSEDLAPRFINSVNNIKNAVDCNNIYAMIIPTSIDITLNDALRADIKSANQKKALDYFNASFKDITAVDSIYDAERLHRDEYTYFRTDHHWTALGAYYAYEQFATEKGIEPTPLKKYQTRTFDGFLGTFYSGSGQTANLAKTPDSVTAYLPFNDVTCVIDEGNGNVFEWDVIKDVTDYGQSLKYLTFIGGDNALTAITNADNPDGETCVVIKESYGNAFVPFLIPHYSTIYVIDPRHYNGTLSAFTQDKEVDDVIFIANISTTRNYIYIEAMEEFIQ